MAFPDLIAKLANGTPVTADEADRTCEAMLSGNLTLGQTGGWLTALRLAGISADVLAGTTRAMHRLSRVFNPARRPVADLQLAQVTGDEPAWLVIASAFTAAATGLAPVALAGGRARTGQGPSEIFEALGFPIHVPRPQVKAAIDRQGIGFLYEPDFLPSLAALAPLRKDLGFATLIDLCMPLLNPAAPEARVLCAPTPKMAADYATAARALGAQRGYILCGISGGPVTGAGPASTVIFESRGQQNFAFDPAAYGFGKASAADFAPAGNAQEDAKLVRAVLNGTAPRPHKDAAVMNAGFVLHAAGAARTLEACFDLARKTLEDGRAARTLDSAAATYKSTGSNPALKPYM